VAVVLPCLNEVQNLPRVIEALLAQDLPRDAYEIVIADGGSDDGSVELAESMGVRVARSPRGVSVQRNRGALETTAPVLAFMDSDCIAPTDWLSRGLRMIEDQGAGLGGGPVRPPQGAHWTARAWDVHHEVRRRRLSSDGAERFRLIRTGNLFIRRDVFASVGGFDESLVSGEDSYLCAQVAAQGVAVAYDDGMAVSHLGAPGSARDFFREQVWHSNGEVWRRLSMRPGGKAGQSARYFGLLTIGTLAIVAVGAVTGVAFGTVWSLVAAVAVYAAIPFALGARTARQTGSLRHLVGLAGVYAIYGLARAAYQLGLLRLDYRRSVPARERVSTPLGPDTSGVG
jgi:GT2 family glycosyltransferase